MNSLEFFAGGVPAGTIFRMQLGDLRKMVANSVRPNPYIDPVSHVCLIALVAYFEAFCKDQFASIINVCPQMLKDFSSRRPDAVIGIKDLVTIDFNVQGKFGFILSEKYDFGTAKSINGLFRDLVGLTPFSAEEARQFSRILNDRNLLVHHGGVITSKYHEQEFMSNPSGNRLFMDSLVVSKTDFRAAAKFLDSIVRKIVRTSARAVRQYIRSSKLKLPKETQKAVKFLS